MAARVAAASSFALIVALAGGAGATPRGIEVEQLRSHAKIVALTFDGAWDDAGVPRILATLARRHATATFFVTGSWVKRYPGLAARIGRRYPVGNHSWSHPQMSALSWTEIRKELRRAEWWIRAETGRDPKPYFRFPYGDRSADSIAVVNALGYTSVRWSLDTWGWMGPAEGQSKATVLHRVASMLSPGDIVLLHIGANRDGSMLDAEALPAILRLLDRRGYRTVTLDRYVTAPR
jgi:peptidoglycan/xylan/chitin deacetylase (PgdA/CDA1 family)